MADMFLDNVVAYEELSIDYGDGQLSDDEAYDLGLIDNQGMYDFVHKRNIGKTCKFCQKSGLVWKQTNEGWRLHLRNGTQHVCYEPEENILSTNTLDRVPIDEELKNLWETVIKLKDELKVTKKKIKKLIKERQQC